MSKQNLENLLDSMLDESATHVEAEEQEERERREKRERERRATAAREGAKEARAAAAFEAIEELTGLTEGDLRAVLAKAAPDDLLVVLATADDVLQRRILTNLDESSVSWLRANLQHMDRVTGAERDGARAKVLKAANQLLVAGDISVPEPESVGAAAAPKFEEKELRELLTDLVRIAHQAGAESLTEVADSAGEPLLRDGLRLVVSGTTGDALRGQLADVRAALEARYAQRLAWMVEALVAIGDQEDADEFRARLFE